MSMFDCHDEIAYQVYVEGVEQDEEPQEPAQDNEADCDIDPIER